MNLRTASSSEITSRPEPRREEAGEAPPATQMGEHVRGQGPDIAFEDRARRIGPGHGVGRNRATGIQHGDVQERQVTGVLVS